MNRRELMLLLGGAMTAACGARAEQKTMPDEIRRVLARDCEPSKTTCQMSGRYDQYRYQQCGCAAALMEIAPQDESGINASISGRDARSSAVICRRKPAIAIVIFIRSGSCSPG
jgi:hypothetical protein